jgi:hypothetical protein
MRHDFLDFRSVVVVGGDRFDRHSPVVGAAQACLRI